MSLQLIDVILYGAVVTGFVINLVIIVRGLRAYKGES